MKQTSRALCAVGLGLLTLLSSCGKRNDQPIPPAPNPGEVTPLKLPEHLIFLTSVTGGNGSPSASYLISTGRIIPGKFTNANGLPLEVGNTPYYWAGRTYTFPGIMGSTKSQLGCYLEQIDQTYRQVGALPVAGTAATTAMAVLNKDKAYISNWGSGTVQVINPLTLTSTKTIDLNKYAHEGALVRPSVMVLRDGLLYVGLCQLNAQWQTVKEQADIAIIDTQKDELLKVISDTKHKLTFCSRPIDPNSMFIDEQGDIYVNCLGSMEDPLHPNKKAGFLRIKKGETEFDPSYMLRTADIKPEGIAHNVDFFSSIAYLGKGKVLALASINKLDPDLAKNMYMAYVHRLVLIDLQAKTIRVIGDQPASTAMAIGVTYDGSRYAYYSYTSKERQGIYCYDTQTGKIDPEEPYITTEGTVTGIRYIPAN